MNIIMKEILFYLLVLAMVFGCASSREPRGSSPGAPAVPGGTSVAQKFEKATAFLLVERFDDPDQNSRAQLASQFNVGYFGWSSYRLEGDEVKATAQFTTRKSQVVSEQRIDAQGWSAVLQKLDLEISEVPGVPGNPGLRPQEIPLDQIKSPGSFLPAARMDLLRELGKTEGWVRLVEISLRGDKLVLTWDVRF